MQTYNQIVKTIREEPRTWVVTGGAGFIGSNLVQRLLEWGQNVKVMDNMSTGSARNINEIIDVLGLKKSSRLNFIEADIRNFKECIDICEGADHVLHHAAQVSVPLSLDEPIYNNEVNVSGFLNILYAARDKGARSLVYASSSAVYGDSPEQPKKEDMSFEPISPYGLSKAVDELYAALSSRVYGFQTVGLRYFNVFGPRQDPGGAYAAVIPSWISALLEGEDATIFGDGEQTRDFCFIENVIQANILAACSDNRDVSGKAINIAAGSSISINELYKIIRKKLSEKYPEVNSAKPVYQNERPGDIMNSSADISLASQLLSYEPTHDIEKGLEESLYWYIQNHD